jgi:hypothetical protein
MQILWQLEGTDILIINTGLPGAGLFRRTWCVWRAVTLCDEVSLRIHDGQTDTVVEIKALAG